MISLNRHLLKDIKHTFNIQKELFEYQDVLLIDLQKNGICRVLIQSNQKDYPTLTLSKLPAVKPNAFFFHNRLEHSSDLWRICNQFQAHVLIPIHYNKKMYGFLGIQSPRSMFSSRERSMAKFVASYIENMLSNDQLVKNLQSYSGRMQKIMMEMGTLHEITHALKSTGSLDSLLEYIMQKSMSVMQAEAASLMMVIEKDNELEFKVALGPKAQAVKPFRLPMGQGITGWVAENGEAVLIPDAYKDDRFDPSFDKRSGFKTKSILCVPMIHQNNVIGVMLLMNRLDGHPFMEDDKRLFTIFAAQAALSVENARLLHAAIEQERLYKELQVASEIQGLLLPQTLPTIAGLDITATYIPCTQVSGDFYDIITLDEKRYAFVVADVSGKGIPGAMVVANMQATLSAYLEYSHDLLAIVGKLNQSLIRNTTSDRYITFFIGILDLEKEMFTYINAGHNPPLLLLKSGQMQELRTGGIFIGFMPWQFESESISFEEGSLLVMYTDGLVEAMNAQEEEFSIMRFKNVLRKQYDKPSKQIQNKIIEAIKKHTGDQALSDDFTLMIVKRTSS
jgi:sigma-B regulation protein RsbU (phosphoserine phosphatase)